jgi:hypothetical protein
MNATGRNMKSELSFDTVVIKLYAMPIGTKRNRNIVYEIVQGEQEYGKNGPVQKLWIWNGRG